MYIQVVTEQKEGDTVVWMADEKTKACLLCHQKFTVVKRKVSILTNEYS